MLPILVQVRLAVPPSRRTMSSVMSQPRNNWVGKRCSLVSITECEGSESVIMYSAPSTQHTAHKTAGTLPAHTLLSRVPTRAPSMVIGSIIRATSYAMSGLSRSGCCFRTLTMQLATAPGHA
jgi:hypothetical protein